MEERIVEVVKYNPSWVEDYRKEAQEIEHLLFSELCGIYHIGSTSIPNMAAKPAIDILLEAKNLDDIKLIEEKLLALGYQPLRRGIIPYMSYFTHKIVNNLRYHCLIFERNDPQVLRHLRFRDYLIAHQEEANQYTKLKENLAKLFSKDICRYILGKDSFIRSVDAKAKFWPGKLVLKYETSIDNKPKKWTPEKVFQAIEANFIIMKTHFSQYIPAIEFIRTPDYVSNNTSLPSKDLNNVIDTHLKSDSVAKIQNVIKYFNNHKLPFAWFVGQNDEPKNLGTLLLEAGLIPDKKVYLSYLDLNSLDDEKNNFAKLKIIKNIEDWSQFIQLQAKDNKNLTNYYNWLASVYTNDDPFEFYLSYVNNQAVSAGIIVYYDSIADIYQISGSNNHRHTMRQLLLQQAKESGLEIACLENTSDENVAFTYNLFYRETK